MTRTVIGSLFLCLSVGLGADIHAQEVAPPVDQLMQDGSQAYQHGDFEQAVERWTSAAAAYERSAARPEQIDALIRLSEAYQSLGRYQTAAIRLDQAKALAADRDDSLLSIRILWRTGNLYQAGSQYAQAEQSLQEALRRTKTLSQPALTAAILNDLGNLAASQGKFAAALAFYTESFETAQAVPAKLLATTSQVNAARVLLSSKQYRESKTRLDQAAGILRGLEPSHEQASAFITVGLTYAKLRAFLVELNTDLTLAAFQALHDAAKAADQLGDRRASSFAWGHMGKLYEDEHRYTEALGVTRHAILMSRQAAAPEALYRWQWQAGRLLKALGQPKEAIDAYRQAIIAVQSIRPEVSAMTAEEQAGASFRETVGAVYFELADLLLRGADRDADPQKREAVFREARDTVELFKVAELQDYFHDECVQAARAQATGLELVSKTAAVIYPIMLQDRLEILVSLPSGMVRKTVPIGAEALTEEIRAFRTFLEKRSTRQYLSHAKTLYGWLIQPIEPLWADVGINTLVIVPDGALRTIPLAALHDGTQFLIKKYAVATTPGVTLTDPRPLDRKGIKLFSVGITDAVQDFPALPHVARELETIHGLFGGTSLLNKQFMMSRVEEELKANPYSIMHIASHGQFQSDSNETFLLAYDGKMTMDRLEEFVGMLRFREEPLALITLSACETAAGDDRAALGLAGVAIKAGARSALASLWFLDDQASSQLVTEFYQQLHDDSVASTAVALQRAQIKFLEHPEYNHPAYWAAFLLLNNWL
ncbi:MAG: CHAT domain-containing protein [Nitrospirae bacterium]|nr:CHAT domain-containing protein [Nitrospirota bacterium]